MERDLVALAGLDVAVEAVVRGVELALLEPLGPRRVPLEHRLPRLEPVELLGPALPPGLEVLLGLLVDRGIREVRLLDEVLWRGECLLLAEEYLQVLAFLGGLGHLSLPVSVNLTRLHVRCSRGGRRATQAWLEVIQRRRLARAAGRRQPDRADRKPTSPRRTGSRPPRRSDPRCRSRSRRPPRPPFRRSGARGARRPSAASPACTAARPTRGSPSCRARTLPRGSTGPRAGRAGARVGSPP